MLNQVLDIFFVPKNWNFRHFSKSSPTKLNFFQNRGLQVPKFKDSVGAWAIKTMKLLDLFQAENHTFFSCFRWGFWFRWKGRFFLSWWVLFCFVLWCFFLCVETFFGSFSLVFCCGVFLWRRNLIFVVLFFGTSL